MLGSKLAAPEWPVSTAGSLIQIKDLPGKLLHFAGQHGEKVNNENSSSYGRSFTEAGSGETLVEDNESKKKGVTTKLFGVILIFLGILDSMLSWRGGFAVSEFYMFLIASGILLYIVGAIRQGSKT